MLQRPDASIYLAYHGEVLALQPFGLLGIAPDGSLGGLEILVFCVEFGQLFLQLPASLLLLCELPLQVRGACFCLKAALLEFLNQQAQVVGQFAKVDTHDIKLCAKIGIFSELSK